MPRALRRGSLGAMSQPAAPTLRPPPAVPRDSRDDDLPGLHAIYAEAVATGTASFELTPPDLAEMGRRRDALLSAGYPFLVAEAADGTVAGYAYAGPFRPRPAYRLTVEDSIYVAPAHQGRGLGRVLLEALIARCEAQGLRQMIAVIGDSANTGSIALHAACGFRPSGTLHATGFKFGRWIDTVLMQRALGPGAATLPEEDPAP